MKYKHWFLALPALILMIVVAPWYMRAQSLTEQEKSTNALKLIVSKTSTTSVPVVTSPDLQVDIGADRQWLVNDLMLINWKINNVSYTASTTIYFEATNLSTSTATLPIVTTVSNGPVLLTSNPLKWNVPRNFMPGEYRLSSYVYGTSASPILTGNIVTFKVVNGEIASKTVNALEPKTPTVKTPEIPVAKSISEIKPLDSVNVTGLERRILELEKMVALMRNELDGLLGKKIQADPAQLGMGVPQASNQGTIDQPMEPIMDNVSEPKDSDNDGLSDKLEILMGTNVNNSDTDGDGFADGQEVKSGFDPLTTGRLNIKALIKDNMGGKVINASTAQELQKLILKQ